MVECSAAMRHTITTLLLASIVAAFIASTAWAQDHSIHQHGAAPPGAGAGAGAATAQSQPKAVLLEDLGSYSFPVSTKNEQAQKFFNQGMVLLYGFNHDEAVLSFKQATELDP